MYPVGTNVLNERTIAESARGPGRLRHRPQGGRRPAVVRDRPRHPAQLARVRRALRPGPGRRRVQGLPVPRAPLDPPALARRPVPEVRRRDHDHRVAQRRRRTTGSSATPRPAARSSRPTTRGSSPASRPPPTARSPRRPTTRALADGSIVLAGPEVDESYLNAVVGESVSHGPRHLDRLHPDARRRRDLGGRRPDAGRASTGSTSSPPSAPPTATSRTSPATSRTPRSPRPSTPRSPRPRPPAPTSSSASDPDADRIGVGLPRHRRPRRATGPPSTATRSASCSPRSSSRRPRPAGKLRPDHYVVTTLVSSLMARALCEREGVRIEDDLLVGFKWIGQRIDEVGPGRVPVRLRGVARLPQGHPRPRQGRRRRRPALRRAGRDGQGPQADGPRIPRRPLHRRRPPRRAADQQGDRGPPRASSR